VYAVREIEPFFRAMHASASRLCVLSLLLRHINAAMSPFWERFHGQARLSLPCALEACNVLYQLGYYARMHVIPRLPMRYTDLNEAIHDIRHRLRLGSSAQHDAELAAAVRDLLVQNEDGSLSPPEQPAYGAALWWEPA
jgi:hypothetical protein